MCLTMLFCPVFFCSQISQDVVELDPKMFEIACKCFGFSHNEFTMPSTNISPIKVHIQNGIDFIAKAAINGNNNYHCSTCMFYIMAILIYF